MKKKNLKDKLIAGYLYPAQILYPGLTVAAFRQNKLGQ